VIPVAQCRPFTEYPPAIFLMGPTAAGKTALAVELVQRFPLEIVSVDSAMVYRGMDVGTAKPSPEVLAVAPHRLIDIVEPVERYSAARFRVDSLREMNAILARGRFPLLVGGTMLYFRALEYGLADMPPAHPAVRARLAAEAAAYGWPALHARLAAVDPESARRIHPNDPQRVQRALEVWEVTGTTLTELAARTSRCPLPFQLVKLALVPADRSALRARIDGRFEAMLQRGLVEEVEGLRARGDLALGLPAMRAVGYRQVWAYLDGRWDYGDMVARAKGASRQLAKRQLTWLRRERELTWLGLDPSGVDQARAAVDRALGRH
jgi:tRNA dimethylallyltransferase